MRDVSRASHELCRSELKKAKLDRAEQYYKREAMWAECERAGEWASGCIVGFISKERTL